MADPLIKVRKLQLPNRLRVTLVHTPDAIRAAACVRVGVGSHDEPIAHPGLAHFLEHLLFLGGASYRDEQRIMPWTQSRGGRLNASTQACTTDYFFEVVAGDLGEGIKRLVDMLARPLLDRAAQLSEREVLEAEYIARSADAETLIETALASAVAVGHPLQRFVAGRRSSLAVESDDFQCALTNFHANYYHPGNAELWLQGPQALEEMQGLVERLCLNWLEQPLKPEERGEALPLLPFTQELLTLRLPGAPRLVLAFALDGLSAGAEQTLETLGQLLRDESPGGLLAWLGERNLADAVALRITYRANKQSMLTVTFDLSSASVAAMVEAAFLDWLNALHVHAAEVLTACQEQVESLPLAPLEQLRRRVRGLPAALASDCLAMLNVQRMLRMRVAPDAPGKLCQVAGFSLTLDHELPQIVELAPQPWTFTRPMPASSAETGFLYLRWRFPVPPCRSHYLAICHVLRPVSGQAQRRGVELRLDEEGGDWVLSLRGPNDRLDASLNEALVLIGLSRTGIRNLGERLLRREQERQFAELPIRQLVAALPAVLVGTTTVAFDWSTARWDLLVHQAELPVSPQVPGLPAVVPLKPSPLAGGRHWQCWASEGDAALLLFCPLPSSDAECEARWRLLARMLETGFHQRMRGELNLGYALCCGFYQVAGWRGILFAIQSPRVEPDVLFQYLKEFLRAAALEDVPEQRVQELAATLVDAVAPSDVWQDRLAGVASDHRQCLREAASQLACVDLETAFMELLSPDGGWWMLSNRT